MINAMDDKLTTFTTDSQSAAVKFIETQTVKEGVECDIYEFVEDSTRDLAIVRVAKGHKTPLQRVLLGNKTIEGYVAGGATLSVQRVNGIHSVYKFGDGLENIAVLINKGDVMQWYADAGSDLVFYEICEPPYQDGRFENINEA